MRASWPYAFTGGTQLAGQPLRSPVLADLPPPSLGYGGHDRAHRAITARRFRERRPGMRSPPPPAPPHSRLPQRQHPEPPTAALRARRKAAIPSAPAPLRHAAAAASG